MDYAELKATVADWLNRTDLDNAIPTFVRLAEAAFNRIIRTNDMLVRETLTLDGQYLDFPEDYLEVFNIQTLGAEKRALSYKSPELIDGDKQFYDETGVPCFYSTIGNQFEFSPMPAVGQQIEITYYKRIPALSDAVPTNWLLTNYFDIYLYGALVQSAPYLKDDGRTALWGQFLTEATLQLKNADEEARTAGSTLRMGTARTFG